MSFIAMSTILFYKDRSEKDKFSELDSYEANRQAFTNIFEVILKSQVSYAKKR